MDDSKIQARLVELCNAATARERLLWAKVKGRQPGLPGHDPAAWSEWLNPANAVKAVSEELRDM